MERDVHFNKIFWFIAGLVTFCAGLSVFVIIRDPSHTAMVLTFWLSSAGSGSISYLIGSSITKSRNPATPGTANVEISATTTTNTPE